MLCFNVSICSICAVFCSRAEQTCIAALLAMLRQALSTPEKAKIDPTLCHAAMTPEKMQAEMTLPERIQILQTGVQKFGKRKCQIKCNSSTDKKQRATTLGQVRQVPLIGCKAYKDLLMQFIKQLQDEVFPTRTLPIFSIHAWTEELVESTLYILCLLQPNFSPPEFFDKHNIFDPDQAGQFLLKAFYATYMTEQAQQKIMTYLLDNAIESTEAIIDYARRIGFAHNTFQIEDLTIDMQKGSNHLLPLQDRKRILIAFLQRIGNVEVPIEYIRIWTEEVVAAAFYVLCHLKPAFPVCLALNSFNRLDINLAVDRLGDFFVLCHRFKHIRQAVIKCLVNQAHSQEAIIDSAREHGHNPIGCCNDGPFQSHRLKEQQHPMKMRIPDEEANIYLQNVPLSDVNIIECPGDGNCLFTALEMSKQLRLGSSVPPYIHRSALGSRLREFFLKWAQIKMDHKESLPGSDGVSLQSFLVDQSKWSCMEDYISDMTQSTTETQWGGYAEAHCIASWWGVKVLVFNMNEDKDSLHLVCEPIGYPHASITLCILYSGTHFDVVTPGSLEFQMICSTDWAGHEYTDIGNQIYEDMHDIYQRRQSTCVLHSTLLEEVLPAEAACFRYPIKRDPANDKKFKCDICGASKLDMSTQWRTNKIGKRIGGLCYQHWLQRLTTNRCHRMHVQRVKAIYTDIKNCRFCKLRFAMPGGHTNVC